MRLLAHRDLLRDGDGDALGVVVGVGFAFGRLRVDRVLGFEAVGQRHGLAGGEFFQVDDDLAGGLGVFADGLVLRRRLLRRRSGR